MAPAPQPEVALVYVWIRDIHPHPGMRIEKIGGREELRKAAEPLV